MKINRRQLFITLLAGFAIKATPAKGVIYNSKPIPLNGLCSDSNGRLYELHIQKMNVKLNLGADELLQNVILGKAGAPYHRYAKYPIR